MLKKLANSVIVIYEITSKYFEAKIIFAILLISLTTLRFVYDVAFRQILGRYV